MAKNFIILYYAREGSSAIIEKFAAHPNVNVPLFENLDWYLRKDIPQDQIYAVLERLYKDRQLYSALHGWNRDDVKQSSSVMENKEILAFKWRIWGEPTSIARVLQENSVVVFHLFRTDLLNFGMSAYLNDVYFPATDFFKETKLSPGQHLQFASKDLRPKIIDFLRSAKVDVNIDSFRSIVEKYVLHKEFIEDRYMSVFRKNGIETFSLSYEDFQDSGESFLVRLCESVGLTYVHPSGASITKIGRNAPIEQAVNRDDIGEDVQIRDLSRRLSAIVGARLG